MPQSSQLSVLLANLGVSLARDTANCFRVRREVEGLVAATLETIAHSRALMTEADALVEKTYRSAPSVQQSTKS